MHCPICDKELTEGDGRKFETLSDHISDPNNERGLPLRKTYICDNFRCPLTDNLVYWDGFGDLYIKRWELFINLQKRLKSLSSQNILEAQNSFARKLSMQEIFNRKRNKLFRIKNYKWEINRNHICNEQGKIIKYKFFIQTFKYDTPGWIYYQGFWCMFVFCISRFHKNLKQYKKYQDYFYRKELLKNFEPLKEGELKDNYRKVFYWYVTTFYLNLGLELFKGGKDNRCKYRNSIIGNPCLKGNRCLAIDYMCNLYEEK